MEREKHKNPKFQGTKSELISILKNARFTRRTREHRNFPSVFGDRTSFRAKGLSRHTQNRNVTSAFAIEARFLRKGCGRHSKTAVLPQFFPAIEPPFVRKNYVSCRLIGTAPHLKREIEKKEKEEGKRARGQERMCQDVKM